MSYAWFLYSNEVVTGPYTTDQVQSKFRNSEIDANCFVWWKGQREWIPITAWNQQLKSILANAAFRSQKAIWYIDIGTTPIGPLTQNELIEHLRTLNDFARVRLWAIGMQKWKTLFEVQDVMELLGMSRREQERAPLMGSVAISRSNEDPRGFIAKAASISAGGLGISEAYDLHRGDEIALLLKSPDLGSNLHLRGEVVYVTDQGYAGIRFIKVHPETHTIIHAYVKRFFVDEKAA